MTAFLPPPLLSITARSSPPRHRARHPRLTAGALSKPLLNRNAVITGGHRGIGYAITVALAKAGANVTIIDRKGAGDSQLSELISSFGQKYHALQADLSDATCAQQAAKEAMAHAEVDILVNNAGVSLLSPLETMSVSDWDATMSLNVRTPFILSQAFATGCGGGSGMLSRGRGAIVNVSSISGTTALADHAAYCSSKAALDMLTKNMTVEWGGRGVRVNGVAPTVVMTEMGRRVWSGEKGGEMLKRIPQGRFVEPEEVADVVVFLASDAAAMVNGVVIPVEGGFGCG